jgi:chromosome segregation ATPase
VTPTADYGTLLARLERAEADADRLAEEASNWKARAEKAEAALHALCQTIDDWESTLQRMKRERDEAVAQRRSLSPNDGSETDAHSGS